MRVDEIRAGYIPHALVFACDHVQTEHFISPAAQESWKRPLSSENLEQVFTPELMKLNFQRLDTGQVLRGQNFEH